MTSFFVGHSDCSLLRFIFVWYNTNIVKCSFFIRLLKMGEKVNERLCIKMYVTVIYVVSNFIDIEFCNE